MNPFSWLFGSRVLLQKNQREQLQAWRALAEPDLSLPHAEVRHVVVDVESSGLNTSTDHLIAIGAVAVKNLRIELQDSFYAVLRQKDPSTHENILIHRIGGTEQTEGEEPVDALLRFLAFAGKAPLVGFHSPFDEIMMRRAMRQYLGEPFSRKWMDLAWLAPAILPALAAEAHGLDDWTARFGIVNTLRHNALADAMATAQLFLVLQDQARRAGKEPVRDLLEIARGQQWLGQR